MATAELTAPPTERGINAAGEPTKRGIKWFQENTPYKVENFRLNNINWVVFGFIATMHLGCLAAPFAFSWSAVAVALVLHWMTASLGICLGYHRYLSHRSLKLAAPARFICYLAGTWTAEGRPFVWAANHRLHHALSDKEGDPHSPVHGGGWWAHLNWMWIDNARGFEEETLQKFAPDLLEDKMLRFFDRTFLFWNVLLGVALYAIGGWPWVVWGVFVRTTLVYHSTWFVNSATHLWGYRNYETRDESRNLWWVALLSYGEGWHNNHHAHPSLAPAGHRWWEFDMTMWSIRFFQAIGWAWDVKDKLPEHRHGRPAKAAEGEDRRPAVAETTANTGGVAGPAVAHVDGAAALASAPSLV